MQKELEQRARELTQSNEELEQFAYIASHDLQEPIRTMAGFANLLEKKYKDKELANIQTLATVIVKN